MKPKAQPVSNVRPIGPMDAKKIPAQRIRCKKGSGSLAGMWCAPLRFQRPTKERLRILNGTLKTIMRDVRRPLDGTVQLVKGVRKRVAVGK